MTQFASDDFTGTVGTELSAHNSSWVNRTRAGAENCVLTNANRVRGPSNTNEYYHTSTPPSADYSVEADIYIASAAASISASVFARGSTTYTSACYVTLYGGSGLRLYKQSGGAFTQLGSPYAYTVVAGTTPRIKIAVSGTSPTTIKAYLDGVERLSYTDSTTPITVVGKAGIRFANLSSSSTDSTNYHIDNFSADDFSTGGISLTGANCTQVNLCSAGIVAIDGVETPINLVGANCADTASSGTGAITIAYVFAGSNCIQNNLSGTGAITQTGGEIPVTLNIWELAGRLELEWTKDLPLQ